MKLGKLPATQDDRDLRLASYMNLVELPAVPEEFGHHTLVSSWGMLGNDRYGDCVFAGAGHETMLWTASAGKQTPFDDAGVLAAYSAVTGFDPNDPNTDQGTNVREAMSYRRKHGIADTAGKEHKLQVYASVAPKDLTTLAAAAYLFGACGIGVEFPETAMEQFHAGEPWSVVEGAKIEGGHYIPVVGRKGGNYLVVTWGKLQEVTPEFLETYCDEAWAPLSKDALHKGKTLEGFNDAQLLADLGALHAVHA